MRHDSHAREQSTRSESPVLANSAWEGDHFPIVVAPRAVQVNCQSIPIQHPRA